MQTVRAEEWTKDVRIVMSSGIEALGTYDKYSRYLDVPSFRIFEKLTSYSLSNVRRAVERAIRCDGVRDVVEI